MPRARRVGTPRGETEASSFDPPARWSEVDRVRIAAKAEHRTAERRGGERRGRRSRDRVRASRGARARAKRRPRGRRDGASCFDRPRAPERSRERREDCRRRADAEPDFESERRKVSGSGAEDPDRRAGEHDAFVPRTRKVCGVGGERDSQGGRGACRGDHREVVARGGVTPG